MTQTDRENYLKYLSIGYYVFGVIVCLFSMFPCIHLFIGVGLLSGLIPEPAPPPNQVGGPPPEAMSTFIGVLFTMMSLIFICAGLFLGVCHILAGKNLASRKSHRTTFILACITCVVMPFGTVLGVLSIILLVQEETKSMFLS